MNVSAPNPTSIIDNTEAINTGVELLPQTNDEERPALRIAGVLVFAYVDSAGTLRVTVDTETPDEYPEWEDGVPVQINVNDGTVFDDRVD